MPAPLPTALDAAESPTNSSRVGIGSAAAAPGAGPTRGRAIAPPLSAATNAAVRPQIIVPGLEITDSSTRGAATEFTRRRTSEAAASSTSGKVHLDSMPAIASASAWGTPRTRKEHTRACVPASRPPSRPAAVGHATHGAKLLAPAPPSRAGGASPVDVATEHRRTTTSNDTPPSRGGARSLATGTDTITAQLPHSSSQRN